MSKDLYLSIYNMMTGELAKHLDCRQQFVEYIDDNFNVENDCLDKHTLQIIARENKRINELRKLIELFEKEVELPGELR